MTITITLFDLDHTLLLGDSDFEWGEFLCDHNIVDPQVFRQKNKDFYDDYLAGTLDMADYYHFALEPFRRKSHEEMTQLRAKFIDTIIQPLIPRQAKDLVYTHQAQGDICAIITATQSFITRPIADLFKIEHLIATEPKIVEGRFNGEIEGTPCFQAGKVTRFNTWIEQVLSPEQRASKIKINAYSDSFNDLPLLEMADEATAVNPDDKLLAIAKARGWKILDFSHTDSSYE